MADVVVKRLDEIDSYKSPEGVSGQFLYAGRSLGLSSLGLNVLRLPPNWDAYPEHDHVKDGQEEVYVVIEGSATLHAGGQSWPLERGTLARVGPGEKRTIRPGASGVTLVALGGIPGKPYERPVWMKG